MKRYSKKDVNNILRLFLLKDFPKDIEEIVNEVKQVKNINIPFKGIEFEIEKIKLNKENNKPIDKEKSIYYLPLMEGTVKLIRRYITYVELSKAYPEFIHISKSYDNLLPKAKLVLKNLDKLMFDYDPILDDKNLFESDMYNLHKRLILKASNNYNGGIPI